jgi:hypothetical protein
VIPSWYRVHAETAHNPRQFLESKANSAPKSFLSSPVTSFPLTYKMLSGNNPHPLTNSRLRGRSPMSKDRARISPPPPTTTLSPLRPHGLRRRRRAILFLTLSALLFFFLFSSSHDLFGLPPALQGLRRVSPASIAALVRPRPGVNELHGLLYYVVQENEALADDAPDPTRPIDLSVYADGNPAPDWLARVKLLDQATPLIVFSKVCLVFRISPFFFVFFSCPFDNRGWLTAERYCVTLHLVELERLFFGKKDVLLVSDLRVYIELRPHEDSYCRYSRRAKDILARYDLVPQAKIIEVDLRGA